MHASGSALRTAKRLRYKKQPPRESARRLNVLRNADFSNSALITVLLIVHYSRRWADHLQLSAHFLNLLGLLLECCGQGLNLIFLQSNPCRLFFSHSLQLLRRLMLLGCVLSLSRSVFGSFFISHWDPNRQRTLPGKSLLSVLEPSGVILNFDSECQCFFNCFFRNERMCTLPMTDQLPPELGRPAIWGWPGALLFALRTLFP